MPACLFWQVQEPGHAFGDAETGSARFNQRQRGLRVAQAGCFDSELLAYGGPQALDILHCRR